MKFIIIFLWSSLSFGLTNSANIKLAVDNLNDTLLLGIPVSNSPSVTVLNSGFTDTAPFSTRTDTFTTTTSGTVLSVLTTPTSRYSIQCTQTGSITSWTAVLEGSLDNVGFTTILTHTNVIGTGVSVFSLTNVNPALYFRTRVVAIILGAGTNIVCTILGIQ